MAQRLQFTSDMARWLCNFSDTEIWKIFRAVTSLVYEWKEIDLPEKLQTIYLILKPYIDDDIDRHKKYIQSKSDNWKLWWRPKASFTDTNNNPSDKPKKAKKTKKATDMIWYDIYSNNMYIVNNISIEEKEKLKKEFPKKNLDVEIPKMCNNWAGKNKKIKKPVQALRNRLLPKKWDNEYIEWLIEKDDDQWITEFLKSKQKFWDKYWEEKYYEVKDKWISRCLAQPLVL